MVKRFLGRAGQAIRMATHHKEALDENRRLANLNSIARLLVNQEPDPPLLYKIAGTTLNVLAADAVTLHEYVAGKDIFLNAAIAGHCRDPIFTIS